MAFKFAIDDRGTSVPPRSQVGRLSTDLDEGMKVTLSDGEQVSWNPPPANPVIPDLSKVKQLAKYFNRGGFQPYPAWFYHPTEEPTICKTPEEAAEIGVGYREATEEERQRFGLRALWDWNDDSPWRPKPWPGTTRFNPNKPGPGKNYIPATQSHAQTQRDLADDLIPRVAAAVASALHGSGGPSKPAALDDAEWQEFIAFQAWKKTKEAVADLAHEERPSGMAGAVGVEDHPDVLEAIALNDEHKAWSAEAERLGVKVDKRWGLERLKTEVAKASTDAAA